MTSARLKADITQEAVSMELDLGSPQYISNFERGVCGMKIEKLSQMRKLYGVSRKELFNTMVLDVKTTLSQNIS